MDPETDPTTDPAAEPAETAPNFSAITDAIAAGFASMTNPQGTGPEPVSAGRQVEHVNEASPYRFDGLAGAHDFSTDLFAGLRFGNSEAMERVQTFMAEAFSPAASPAFDVNAGNVATLNPARVRPDMYVDRLTPTTPLYDALHKGAITDQTPFLFPKFASATNLVAPHVEGVEPAAGGFTATNQTVTPTPVSGKVPITREVWDQGGNPQVSGLIWREMTRAYYEALEAKVAALLAAAAPQVITLPANAVNAALVTAMEGAIADLQFIPGGMRFRYAPLHADLYKNLSLAQDTTGRKLLPMIGATNANGTADPRFAGLDIAGIKGSPTWSLGAAGAGAKASYLIAPEDVHVWNSAPQRFEFQTRVAFVDLAIWGYSAEAISRLDGVRRINYTRPV